ncbi:hypothetical protein E2C01_025249 [Portunus trituberculatus]|uniref:Uncharacterized protein n=1 Tax=Portunus trituberculatus TaxID=210409 RepID=A0A5B7EF94_PORTR|nr:hypothetical protein [Portunus trituberculatus]
MVLGIVLGSFGVLCLAAGMLFGFLKMLRRVIIHKNFPDQVYHKTTGTEEDGSERLHAPLNRTALYSSHRTGLQRSPEYSVD